MARSDSESLSASNSKAKPTKGDPESEDDAGSEAGTEYEIEEVIDAKRGYFPDGRMGYLVKWKGYGPDDNSWVDEQDAGNALELVEEFWRKNPHKKGPRKSVDKKTQKKSRMSVPTEDGSDADEAPATKKRSRKSNAQNLDNGDMDVDEVAEKPTKKAKTNSTQANKAKPKNRSPTPEQVILESMKAYSHLKSWEGLVKTVDTIERDNNELMVYFTLNSGEKARQSSSICNAHFPQKLLSFYESNLRWREAQNDDFDEA